MIARMGAAAPEQGFLLFTGHGLRSKVRHGGVLFPTTEPWNGEGIKSEKRLKRSVDTTRQTAACGVLYFADPTDRQPAWELA